MTLDLSRHFCVGQAEQKLLASFWLQEYDQPSFSMAAGLAVGALVEHQYNEELSG
jgi:hypothetical protein